jgi:hypothetical protein
LRRLRGGNNWARGFHGEGAALVEQAMDAVRREAEVRENQKATTQKLLCFFPLSVFGKKYGKNLSCFCFCFIYFVVVCFTYSHLLTPLHLPLYSPAGM